MTCILTETRAWLEDRYHRAGLGLPRFRWVRREAPGLSASPGSGALLVEDPELRLLLLLLDLAGTPGPEAMAEQVQGDLQAAWGLRSTCLPAEGPGLPGAAAAWRVAVHWLGAADQESGWRASILHARQSGFILEEIPVNAAFPGPGELLRRCLDQGGFPVLLLATRQVFRKDARAMDLWASADRRVRDAVADLEEAVPAPRARAIARELQALARQEIGGGNTLPSGPPTRLGSLNVQNVRGVRNLTLEPWPGGSAVQAWVVSGPNGSGKSSLAEAVSLRAFGASAGLCAYLADADVSRARNAQGYLGQYLTPVDGGVPRCGFDGAAGILTLAGDLDSALEAMAEAEGTLAPQGGPAGFLHQPGDELGARMARSFSALAVRLEAHVEAGRRAAGDSRTALARKHGISSGVRRLDTFREKIVRSALAAAVAGLPPGPAEFLACRAALPGPAGAAARALRDAWSRVAQVEDAVQSLLKPRPGREEDLEGALLPLFTDQETRSRRLAELLAEFRSLANGLAPPALGLAAKASRWAEWLARPREAPAPPAAVPDGAGLALDTLLAERAALTEEGRRTRPVHDHLEQALGFIRDHWRDRHPQDCPTCGSHLSGPVEQAAAALLAEAEAHLGKQRETYAALTRRIKELESRSPDPTGQGCPLSREGLQQIRSALEALLGPGMSAEELLRDETARPAVVRLLAYAEAPPLAAPPIPEAAPAAACAGSILAGWRSAEEALAEPDAWEQVAKELTRRLARVVGEHLPATLEALWRELAACLSPAPWLLTAQPRFQARTLRGANRVEVVLAAPDGEPRLARHLLNDAQVNTLGLAWTFCQHLVRARFRHAWMLLDDPAQDMDQPAYRAFCRFLATLLGLYEAGGQPFTLVLLLNQEDRAMDAARETGQGLTLLGWTGRQEDATVQRITLFGEGIRSPQPGDLWAQTAG